MAGKHNIAMFAEKNGERVQVGWASPAVDGVRTFEFSAGFDDVKMRDVTFEDDENAQKAALEEERLADEARREAEEDVPENAPEEVTLGGKWNEDGSPNVDYENSEEDAEPVDAGVELSGGQITDVADEDDQEEETD